MQQVENGYPIDELASRSLREFIHMSGGATQVDLDKRRELWEHPLSSLLVVLRLVKECLDRQDYIFFEVDKRFREELPLQVWYV